MAYGLKYRAQYKSRSGVTYQVDIRDQELENDFSAVEIRLATSPRLRHNFQEEFASINGKILDLELHNSIDQGHFFYEDMFGSSEIRHMVELLEDGVLQFRGFIIPELYQDIYAPLPNVIYASASDRISSSVLNNYDVLTPTGGLTQLSTVISDILSKTGSGLGWIASAHIYDITMFLDEANSPFEQSWIYSESLRDNNEEPLKAGDMLEHILHSFQSRIIQAAVPGRGLYWIIERVQETAREQRRGVVFNPGASNPSDYFNLPRETMLINADRRILQEGTRVEKFNGHKRLTARVDLMLFENLFNTDRLSSTFPVPSIPSLSEANPEVRSWQRHDTMRHRYFGSDISIVRLNDITNGSFPTIPGGAKLLDGMNTSTWVTITEDTDLFRVDIEHAYTRAIYFESINAIEHPYPVVGLRHMMPLEIRVYNSIGTFLGYIQFVDFDNPSQGYKLDPNLPPDIPIFQYGAYIYDIYDIAEGPNYSDLQERLHTSSWEIPLKDLVGGEPGDYHLFMKIGFSFFEPSGEPWAPIYDDGPLSRDTEIHSLSALMQGVEVDNEIILELDSNYTKEKFFPMRYGYGDYNYKNIIMNKEGRRLTEWAVTGPDIINTEYFELPELLLDHYAQFYHMPRWLLAMTLRGDVIIPANTLIGDRHTGVAYYMAGQDSNTNRAEFGVNLIEFVDRDDDPDPEPSPYSPEATQVLSRFSNLTQVEMDAIAKFVDAEVVAGNFPLWLENQWVGGSYDEFFLFAVGTEADALTGFFSKNALNP